MKIEDCRPGGIVTFVLARVTRRGYVNLKQISAVVAHVIDGVVAGDVHLRRYSFDPALLAAAGEPRGLHRFVRDGLAFAEEHLCTDDEGRLVCKELRELLAALRPDADWSKPVVGLKFKPSK